MKNLFALAAGLLICTTALADNHMETQNTVYGQYFSLIVSDPAAVVAAMQKYRNSPTGQQMPSSVTLSQNVANGDLQGTHTVNVLYPSAEAMETGMQLSASSADSAEFRDAMRTVATVEGENLFTILMTKANREDMANPASMLFGLEVTDQAAFMKALNKLFESEAAANFPGNLNFGQVIAMGDNPTTHWVSFQAESVGALLKAVDAFMQSQDVADYAKNAGDFREITARTVSRQVLALTR